MKTLCFDKTGTLTQPKMQTCRLFHIEGKDTLTDLTAKKARPNAVIAGLFGCCNSV